MLIRKTLPLAAMALVVMPAPASAQASAAAPSITRAQLLAKVETDFKASDTNGDGKISKAEIQGALDRRAAKAEVNLKQSQQDEFNKLDANKDGKLTLAEYQAGTSISVRPEAVDQRLKQLDTNHDGVVTIAEFRAEMLGEFDRIDTNKDGVLSAAEAGGPNR